jgi:hypothetical protein
MTVAALEGIVLCSLIAAIAAKVWQAAVLCGMHGGTAFHRNCQLLPHVWHTENRQIAPILSTEEKAVLFGWFGLVIALRPQTPKHIRGGWSHYTDTSEPVDGGVLWTTRTILSVQMDRENSLTLLWPEWGSYPIEGMGIRSQTLIDCATGPG